MIKIRGKRSHHLAIAAVLLLSGCKHTPPYEQPYKYAPSSKTEQYQASKKTLHTLNSLNLDELIRIPHPDEHITLGDLFDLALQNSPKTAQSWLYAKSAAAEYGSSFKDYFPQASFDGFFIATREGFVFNDSLTINDQIAYGPKLNLSWMIWDSGERAHNVQIYYQALQYANFAHSEEVQMLLQTVSTAYYGYLYSKALVAALEEDLLNAEETYLAAQLKFSSGVYSNTDMLQAKTNYLQKKVQLTEGIRQKKNAYVELLEQIGIPCDADLNLGDFLQQPPQSPYDYELEDLVAMAEKYRPDFYGAKAQVLSAKADWQKTRSELMPSIAFEGNGGVYWYNQGQTDRGNYDLELHLTFPIFTGFWYVNQIKAKESIFEKSKAALQELELSIIKEVRTSKNDLSAAEIQLADTKSYLEAASIEAEAMLERYKRGVVNILDLLQSQAFLADARAQYIEAQKSYYTGLINVAYSIGTLTNGPPLHWEFDE